MNFSIIDLNLPGLDTEIETLRLSDIGLVLMRCCLEARGETATHATLFEHLGNEQSGDSDNWLHATM